MARKNVSKTSKAPTTESRRDRRKRETRERLLRAAMTLMATRPKEAITINEITEAADVSFGSFYNYFESKEDIFERLAEEFLDAFAESLNRLAEVTDDPAEVLAASVRSALLRATEDPVWGRFFIQLSVSTRVFAHRPGQAFLRDIQAGLDAGRFHVSDPSMAIIAVSGTILAAAVVASELPDGEELAAEDASPVRLETAELPERTASAILQTLGLQRSDAVEVARRPLPEPAE